MRAYDNLGISFAQIQRVQSAANILSLDLTTNAERTELSATRYKLISDPHINEWLNEAETNKAALSSAERRNLHLMRRDWVHSAGLPADLFAEKARIEIVGQDLHYAKYKTASWNDMKDWYAGSFDVARQCGEAKKDKLGVATAYEALLDEYSTEMRLDIVDPAIAKIDEAIPKILAAALGRQKGKTPPVKPAGPFPFAEQYEMNKRIATKLGFDFKRGQMLANDTWFTVGTPDETYITTGFDLDNLLYGFIQHETGHGLYAQGLPKLWRNQPAGEYMGLATHEMMAMIIECHATTTPSFFNYIADNAQQIFNRCGDKALTAEHFVSIQSWTEPSFKRVLADELTYPLHVTLRASLERDAIAGKLNIRNDLPDAWNEGFKKRLGITPPTANDGCLQDVHWPSGMIGYFPDYALGRMGAAQMYQAATQSDPSIANGEIKPLVGWLRKNVYSKGSLLTMRDLFTRATGAPLGPDALIAHLQCRFLAAPFMR